MGRLSARWEHSLDSLGKSGAKLNELLETVPDATIFNTWEWVSSATCLLPEKRRKLAVLTAWRDDNLMGCLPLSYGRETFYGVPAHTLRDVGDPLADCVPLAISQEAPEGLELALDALFDAPQPWDAVILSELPDTAELRCRIGSWSAKRNVKTHWRRCARVPVLPLDFADEHALKASYSKTLRTRLQRARKKLMAAGQVRFERIRPGPEAIDELLQRTKAIEDASWKGQQQVGIFSTDSRYRFFRLLSRQFAAHGWLDLSFLWLNDRPISYHYGFRFRDVFLDYNLAFLPEFSKFSPGRVLLDEVIISSVSERLKAVDASRASLTAGHLLRDWTSEYRDHYQLWISAPTLRGHLLHTLMHRLKPIAKRIRDAVKTSYRRY